MSHRSVSTSEAAPPGGRYSQGIVAGNLVFLAGQTPFTADGQNPGGSFEEQARRTFDNLAAVARAAGGSLADTVRVGVYLSDLGDFAALNEIWPDYFKDPLPARTTIQADLPGFAIEVDAILVLDA